MLALAVNRCRREKQRPLGPNYPSKLCATLWITLFTTDKTRTNRGFGTVACKVVTAGTNAAFHDSTRAKTFTRCNNMTIKSPSSSALASPSLPQRSRLHLLALPALLGLGGLAGCGDKKDETAAPAAKSTALSPAQAYDKIAAEGKGFTVGALMAANPAYVLFDPQCPHCGHLWTASQALLPKAKFVWIPVSFINGKSAPQGAAILTAANPAEFMAAHEASLLAGSGGTPLPASVPPEVEAIIKANTVLFNDLAAESVPYMVAKNVKTGQVVANAGAMQTAALAEFLGVN